MTTRIFDEGKAASGSQIGTYTKAYIETRKKKGLGSSSKVILEFTGQMRNDYHLIQDGPNFASGFLNKVNGDKSEWVEDTYDKEIFNLTKKEQELLDKLVEEKVNDALSR